MDWPSVQGVFLLMTQEKLQPLHGPTSALENGME